MEGAGCAARPKTLNEPDLGRRRLLGLRGSPELKRVGEVARDPLNTLAGRVLEGGLVEHGVGSVLDELALDGGVLRLAGGRVLSLSGAT